ncbi:hypothetical protein [Nostoc sp. TCL26-01]|uniref:hypothetical protein n=1 Tax=Nostoc sp. TCL26-01 TaxID=2576904 RepID=UPI0015C13B49|nr:hypothetical protein [Nostoc sp. TCL26-01]QLE58854.1 hypothetical protein FD725_27135 [Nostoc sp. TCL26-01]
MFEKFWAIRNSYYTNKVHLCGLTQNQVFQTCGGRFRLCSQATALGRHCVVGVPPIEASVVGFPDL